MRGFAFLRLRVRRFGFGGAEAYLKKSILYIHLVQ